MVALRDRHRHSTKVNKPIHIQKGDVCVLHDPHCPRTFWRLAIIQDPIPGRDGQVRGAVVKTITWKGVVSILRHPIKYLYPLKISKIAGSHSEDELSLHKGSNESLQRQQELQHNELQMLLDNFKTASMLI